MNKSSKSAVLDRPAESQETDSNLGALAWYADMVAPQVVNDRVGDLLEKNSAGQISDDERAELELLIEADEHMSIAKVMAHRFLQKRHPG